MGSEEPREDRIPFFPGLSELEINYNDQLELMQEILPDADPTYLAIHCEQLVNNPDEFQAFLEQAIETKNYPTKEAYLSSDEPPEKRRRLSQELSEQEVENNEGQLELMSEVLPDADPTYLAIHCGRLANNPDEFQAFLEKAIETKNYPTREAHLRNLKISAQTLQYTSEFSIQKFLEVVPNPQAYFNDQNRNTPTLDAFAQNYVFSLLRNDFPYLKYRTIEREIKRNKYNFLTTFKTLKSSQKEGISKRPRCIVPPAVHHIPLLQEIAYAQHEKEILQYIQHQEQLQQQLKLQAKKDGILLTCKCCYDDDVMPINAVFCDRGCTFCKSCVERYIEILFAEGKLDFPCLDNCTEYFNLHILQQVLKPNVFSKLVCKKQMEEIKAAGIEELETCPFCEFATIPAPDDKIFRCLNPDCMKETCRLCHEQSHIPLRCEEVEKDEFVARRTYIEDKMTEALVRICYKCGMKFIKSDGCNEIKCPCGAVMCYVCGAKAKDFSHFNARGDTKFGRCPLYSDTVQLHKEAVLKGADAAKEEVGAKDDPTKLKVDPTVGIEAHFSKKKY